jgi:alpha-galactosidase
MTDEIKSILMNTEVIAVDQDKAVNPPKKISEQGTSIVIAKTLADGSTAVGLFNRGDNAAQIAVSWSSLGISGRRPKVRDLWQHKEVEISGDSYTTAVPKHGVVMLSVA